MDLLWDKYGVIFALINIMDEFYYLISGRGLLEDPDHIIFNRYIKILKKCKEDSSKMENCKEVCQELNINRYTYMWDGEPELI